jgi:hypothetical protein
MGSDEMQNQSRALEQNSKKSYVKPDVRHEQVFETMALNCGKAQATQTSCKYQRSSS